jgi:hypothetical protein
MSSLCSRQNLATSLGAAYLPAAGRRRTGRSALSFGTRWRSHFKIAHSYQIVAGALSLGACNPFRGPLKQDPVAQGTTHDANVDSRWHGTLTSPSNIAGAVQVTGHLDVIREQRRQHERRLLGEPGDDRRLRKPRGADAVIARCRCR